MTRSRILIAACACTLIALAASAAVVTVNWTNATKNTDDTNIPASGAGSIQTTRIEWSQCGPGDTFGTKAGEISVAGTAMTAKTPDLAPGRWCLRAIHVNTFGSESAPSPIAVKVIDAPTPRPPSNFSVS